MNRLFLIYSISDIRGRMFRRLPRCINPRVRSWGFGYITGKCGKTLCSWYSWGVGEIHKEVGREITCEGWLSFAYCVCTLIHIVCILFVSGCGQTHQEAKDRGYKASREENRTEKDKTPIYRNHWSNSSKTNNIRSCSCCLCDRTIV